VDESGDACYIEMKQGHSPEESDDSRKQGEKAAIRQIASDHGTAVESELLENAP
jgi:hypothetical protein